MRRQSAPFRERHPYFGERLVLGLAVLAIGILTGWLVSQADGSTFKLGIADPGRSEIPASTVSSLGLAVERRSVVWSGEAVFSGQLNPTSGLRTFVAVYGGYPTPFVPADNSARLRYCGFVVSILERYPQIHDVVVWNEPSSSFWGIGPDSYARLVAACSPLIRAHSARVWAPGMNPSEDQRLYNWAWTIAHYGKHLIDGWDQHLYAGHKGSIAQTIYLVRSVFGWKVPVLVGESGSYRSSQPADVRTMIRNAYCAGASGWMNFKLRDGDKWLSLIHI